MNFEIEARQLRTMAEMLERWQAQPTCDAIQCVIESLRVQADRWDETAEDIAVWGDYLNTSAAPRRGPQGSR